MGQCDGSGDSVIPAKAGIQERKHWTPAYAGVTAFGLRRCDGNTVLQ